MFRILVISACLMLPLWSACDSEESDDASHDGAVDENNGADGEDASEDGDPPDNSSDSSKDAGSDPPKRDASAGSDAGGSGDPPTQMSNGDVVTIGKKYEGGQFHLGPVDWEETQWHNACAPSTKYAAQVRQAEGTLLVGLWGGLANVAGYCDACIHVTTAKGKSALLRVVTYGDTTSNSIDVSPDAMKLLDSGEYPRAMTWSFAKCPDTGKIIFEFQTGSSEYWTSLWVRNARLPLAKVEVKSKNHASYALMERAGDGTLTDGKGFGVGEFSIRLTSVDGKEYVDTFAWPAGGIAGKTLVGQSNFP